MRGEKMKLKTLRKSGDVVLKEYSEEECRRIFTERNSYILKCIRFSGNDYGGNHCSEDQETSFEEIIPERILVRDGSFCGVLILTEYEYYNGGCDNRMEEVILLSGEPDRSARIGFSFSNDDHSRWDYTDYYLVSSEEAE